VPPVRAEETLAALWIRAKLVHPMCPESQMRSSGVTAPSDPQREAAAPSIINDALSIRLQLQMFAREEV